MNWIDDKYKEKLGNKKFPDSLKEAGWAKAEKLLDKEMPIAPGGGISMTGKYLLALLAVVTIPSAIWYFSQSSELPADDAKSTPAVNAVDEQNNYDQNLNSLEIEEGDDLKLNDIGTITSTPGGAEKGTEEISQEESHKLDNDNISSMAGTVSKSGENSELNSKVEEAITATSSNSKSSDNTKGNNVTIDSQMSSDQSQGRAKSELPKVTVEGQMDASTTSNTEVTSTSNNNNKTDSSNSEQDTDIQNGEESTKPGDLDQKVNEDDLGDANDGQVDDQSTDDPQADENNDMTNSADQSSSSENKDSEEPQENLIPEENQTVLDENKPNEEEEDSTSNEEAVNSPDEDADLTSAIKNKRKEHLAFLDLPNEASISDQYHFFSRERFSLSLWGGYTYTDKFLSASNANYTDKRQAEEKAIWTTPTGVDLDYFLNGRWTLGLGLRWTEYGEDLQYDINHRDTAWIDGRHNDPSNFSNVVAVDSARIITGINQGHWNYVVVTESVDSAVISNNGRTSWQYVEIPLMLGYRFGQGSFRPWIKSGVSFGIPISTNFRYLNPEATQLNDLSLTHSKLVAPLQYNYLLDVGVDCYLTRNFSIRLNATSSVQLNSSLRQSAIKQRYYRLGLGIGIAYNF